MLKDLIFPVLEPNEDKKGTSRTAADIADAPAAPSAPRPLPDLAGAGGIDISQFPVIRAAFGISSDDSTAAEDAAEIETAGINADCDEAADKPTADNTPAEEPIPAIFAGIGRTDRGEPLYETEDKNIVPLYDIGDYYPSLSDAEFEEAPETSGANEESDADEEPKPPEITEYDLLDYIDDIEFSDLGPEGLKPVKTSDSYIDPYFTRFNSPQEESEPDELPIKPGYKFEQE